MSKPVTNWIRPEIQQLSAYYVPEQSNVIKLDAMENPYSWDAVIIEEWLKILRTTTLNRYPDSAARKLKSLLRTIMQVPERMEMVVGNGSDELIQMLILALNGPQRVLLVPEPSFIMYRHLAQVVGMKYVGVPLQKNSFTLDMYAMLEAIETYQPALVFLAYPNNPTGNLFAAEDIEAILETAPGVVVIDEAYASFTNRTFMLRLEQYPNLLIMRTVSKLGLAGLRLGLLAGAPSWLTQIEKVRQPYNINVLTQVSATFALRHYTMFKEQIQRIREDREILLDQLSALKNVYVWPSQANFILFRVAHAQELANQLQEKGILIKCVHGRHPLLEDCLQVTIGTSRENQAFFQALKQLL
jgi:histidinol-phosphate aminotransferase